MEFTLEEKMRAIFNSGNVVKIEKVVRTKSGETYYKYVWDVDGTKTINFNIMTKVSNEEQSNNANVLLCDVWVRADKTVREYPLGTKFKALMGGYWTRVERGFKWCTGSTFPNVGGDWTGEVCLPNIT
jgi:hypothetical protein